MFETEQHVLAAWNVGAIQSIVLPATGTINQTHLIGTASGRYVLRRYRRHDLIGVQREHALISYARSRGLPAVAPLPSVDGATIVTHDQRMFALFPFAPGQQINRDALRQPQITAMGAWLARLHQVLKPYPHANVDRRDLSIDRDGTLAQIDQFDQRIRSQPTLAITDEYALLRLAGQRRWIEQHAATAIDLDHLPQQVIHGDYTEANLFFAADQISAIIDWEQAYVAPCAWEIVRTIDLVLRFDAAACQAFLDAYRGLLPLTWDELDHAALCYATVRAHDLWMYEAAYDQGNDRVRQFWGPDGFVPLDEQWSDLRNTRR